MLYWLAIHCAFNCKFLLLNWKKWYHLIWIFKDHSKIRHLTYWKSDLEFVISDRKNQLVPISIQIETRREEMNGFVVKKRRPYVRPSALAERSSSIASLNSRSFGIEASKDDWSPDENFWRNMLSQDYEVESSLLLPTRDHTSLQVVSCIQKREWKRFAVTSEFTIPPPYSDIVRTPLTENEN